MLWRVEFQNHGIIYKVYYKYGWDTRFPRHTLDSSPASIVNLSSLTVFLLILFSLCQRSFLALLSAARSTILLKTSFRKFLKFLLLFYFALTLLFNKHTWNPERSPMKFVKSSKDAPSVSKVVPLSNKSIAYFSTLWLNILDSLIPPKIPFI